VTVNVVLMVQRARPAAGRSSPASRKTIHEPIGLAPTRTRLAALPAAFRRLLDKLPEEEAHGVHSPHESRSETPAGSPEMVIAPVLTVRTRLFYARRENHMRETDT
jgi:RNA polymerase sigma-70 factor (ECF subfamily)